jgi:hypothetical protein
MCPERKLKSENGGKGEEGGGRERGVEGREREDTPQGIKIWDLGCSMQKKHNIVSSSWPWAKGLLAAVAEIFSEFASGEGGGRRAASFRDL